MILYSTSIAPFFCVYAHNHVRTYRTINMWVNEVSVTGFAEPNAVCVTIDWNVISDELRNGHPLCDRPITQNLVHTMPIFYPVEEGMRTCVQSTMASYTYRIAVIFRNMQTNKPRICLSKAFKALSVGERSMADLADGFWGHHKILFLRNQNRKNCIEISIPE